MSEHHGTRRAVMGPAARRRPALADACYDARRRLLATATIRSLFRNGPDGSTQRDVCASRPDATGTKRPRRSALPRDRNRAGRWRQVAQAWQALKRRLVTAAPLHD